MRFCCLKARSRTNFQKILGRLLSSAFDKLTNCQGQIPAGVFNLVSKIFIKTHIKKFVFVLLLMAIAVASAFWWACPDLDDDCSGSISLNNKEIFFVAKNRDGRIRLPTTIDDVDPLFLKMLIASEDKRFYSHLGVDPIALARALLSDLKAGRIVSGGSTLAMQAVRSLNRRPRTFLQKIKESLGAFTDATKSWRFGSREPPSVPIRKE